jgi:hypothetical protein
MTSFCLRAHLAFFAGLAPFKSPVMAQLVPSPAVPTVPSKRSAPAAADPTVERAPFVIGASSDPGCLAAETRAGNRRHTDFKDVSHQIGTITKDFPQDLGLAPVGQFPLDPTILGYRAKLRAFSETSSRVPLGIRTVLDADDPVRSGRLTTGAISRWAPSTVAFSC